MGTVTLESQRVEQLFRDCLFQEGEDTSNHVVAEGIVSKVGFHPERLERHREEIAALLDELPDAFKESGGGGMSFISAFMDRHGRQWADLHQTMERLFQLGIAIGKAEYLLPREMWGVMPGGMPYIVVH